MRKKYNWKKLGRTVKKAGLVVGNKGKRLARDIAVGEGRRQKRTGDTYRINQPGRLYPSRSSKRIKRKVVYIYPSGKRKVKYYRKKKHHRSYSNPFNPFNLDF